MTSGAANTAQAQLLVAGRYRLLSPLGGGAMGSVWLAKDQLLGRQVAIKAVAGPHAGASDERRRQAVREGRMAAQLAHPHSVSVYDVAVGSGEPWLVMEYLPSRSLAAVVADGGPLSPSAVAQIGAQIADALAAAHKAEVVHRDVKPGNVLIGTEGRDIGVVKIADFGISRSYADEPADVASELITGTPEYFAPEVARGAEPTAASDVYSLGATLYAAVEGVPPFGLISEPGNRDETKKLLRRVAAGEFDPPRRGGELTPVLLAMMEPDPRRRPGMAVARDQLVDVAADGRRYESVLAARTVLGPKAPAPAGQRRPGRPAVARVSSGSSVTPAAGRDNARLVVVLAVAVVGLLLLVAVLVGLLIGNT